MDTENDILIFWERIQAFEKSLELTKNGPEFLFYEGPPFATGLPHYGHCVGGIIKDAICRWMTMKGHHVDRVWGWDTHGLPIEFEIEKQLGIKTKQQVLEYGIDKYNQACRDIVLKYRDEWKTTINRLGRWIDMDNDYKTMDTSFMESVWWVFSELYNKNLIYKGYKIVPYCMRCGTPLSNFESKDNYVDVSDWSVTIKFKIKGTENLYALVWTTTPWTLPTNLLLCVNSNLKYCYVKYEENIYLVGKDCVDTVFKKMKGYKIINTVDGFKLSSLQYEPLFDYYSDFNCAFKIVCDDYVKAENGTGIVHCSPAHGEDDYRVGLDNNIINNKTEPPCPLDDNGHFISPVDEWKGLNVKDAEKPIIDWLGERGFLFKKNKITHSYPYCWRSDTPLIYKACESWYVNVDKIKDQMVKNNKDTEWVPSHLRDNRFGNWIEGATDWCVSRNRFWGTPIPIWTNGKETICIKSVKQLEELSGKEPGSITDLHRDSIDDIEIPSSEGNEPLRRIENVFDCWFESGSMPYAQNGYTGEGEVPKVADFIAEGIDQTRGWFYTLLVLGTALFDRSPFKNVIVNGIVLTEKGDKMSKRKKNYPPVNDVLDKYGADALRLYLISTKVVKGEDLKFKESGLREITRKYHMMINNMVTFYTEMVGLYKQKNKIFDVVVDIKSNNIMDIWILTCLNSLIVSINSDVKSYKLNGVVNKLIKFIDQLSKWYVNLNKNRFKACDSAIPLSVLHKCLYHFSVLSAPFAPFLSEIVYHKLGSNINKTNTTSVHFQQIPSVLDVPSDDNLIELFEYFEDVVNLVRNIRDKRTHEEKAASSVKIAISHITIVHDDCGVLENLKSIDDYIREELNVDKVNYEQGVSKYVSYRLKPNVNEIKKRVSGREIGKIIKAVSKLLPNQIMDLVNNKDLKLNDLTIQHNEVDIINSAKKSNVVCGSLVTIVYDDSIDDDILERYYAKLLFREYQQTRKDAGLSQTDIVDVYCDDEVSRNLFNKYYPGVITKEYPTKKDIIYKRIVDVEICKVEITLSRVHCWGDKLNSVYESSLYLNNLDTFEEARKFVDDELGPMLLNEVKKGFRDMELWSGDVYQRILHGNRYFMEGIRRCGIDISMNPQNESNHLVYTLRF